MVNVYVNVYVDVYFYVCMCMISRTVIMIDTIDIGMMVSDDDD